MKRFSIVLALALAACQGNPGPGPSPSTAPTPIPTSTPFGCPASAVASPSVARDKMGRKHTFRLRSMRAASNPSNMVYHGGELLLTPSVELIFWGYQSTDPLAQVLIGFFSDVGGSQWDSTMEQYCSTAGFVTNPTGVLAGIDVDMTNPIPASPTQADIASEAQRVATQYGFSANREYVVAVASGHSGAGFQSNWCAWHSGVSYNGGWLSYTEIPYISDAGTNCGEDSVNANGKYDGVTIVGGHEYAESITDPDPGTGWTQPGSNEEIGDLCAWKDLQNDQLVNGTYPMQPLWSNIVRGCAQ